MRCGSHYSLDRRRSGNGRRRLFAIVDLGKALAACAEFKVRAWYEGGKGAALGHGRFVIAAPGKRSQSTSCLRAAIWRSVGVDPGDPTASGIGILAHDRPLGKTIAGSDHYAVGLGVVVASGQDGDLRTKGSRTPLVIDQQGCCCSAGKEESEEQRAT